MAFLLLAFYGEASPSLGEGVAGAMSNPASLGFDTRFGLLAGYSTADSQAFALAGWGGLGVGYWGGELSLLGGARMGWLSLGTAWFKESGSWTLGALARPKDWLSLGLVVPNATEEGRSYAGSAAVRFWKRRITLFGGASWRDSLLGWEAGGALEPLSGLRLWGKYADGGVWTAGLEVSFGKVSLAAWGNDEAQSAGVLLTQALRPRVYTPKRWLKVEISGSWPEDGREILGSKESFPQFITKLREALSDPSIQGVYVFLRAANILGPQAWELRKVLEEASDKGKPVFVYAYSLRGIGYYLASAADRLAFAPEGGLDISGMAGGNYYLKRLADKLGVEFQVERFAKYKTAAEPLTSDTMSEAQREQLEALLESFWDEWVNAIAEGRGLTTDSLETLINVGIFTAKQAVRAGLADTLLYPDQVKDAIEKFSGGKVKFVELKDFKAPEPVRWRDERPVVAVVSAEGTIIEGEGGPSLLGNKTIGYSLAKLIRRLREDKRVKAVVIRVNSPGGSALTSDLIWREVKLLSEKKPVVVSMSRVAASGGYYISCAAKKILVTPFTITGSIGIITIKPVLAGLYDKVGITKPAIYKGEHADFWDEARPWDEAERQLMRQLLEEGYADFKARVAEGRGLSPDSVEAIAQGRVWSGPDAVEIGIADTVGGLLDAVELVKDMLKADEVRLEFYPRGFGLLEAFRKVKSASLREELLQLIIGESMAPRVWF